MTKVNNIQIKFYADLTQNMTSKIKQEPKVSSILTYGSMEANKKLKVTMRNFEWEGLNCHKFKIKDGSLSLCYLYGGKLK